jgi:hypothetical protein
MKAPLRAGIILSYLLHANPLVLTRGIATPTIRLMSTKRGRESDLGNDQNTKQILASTSRRPIPFTPDAFNVARARLLTDPQNNANLNPDGRCVVVWMSRDQRAVDNHAIHYAQCVAEAYGLPVRVMFNMVPKFLEATIRHYGFMIKGLQEVEQVMHLCHLNITLWSNNSESAMFLVCFASSRYYVIKGFHSTSCWATPLSTFRPSRSSIRPCWW